MSETDSIVHLQIVEFEGPNAILNMNDNSYSRLVWPVKNLPSNIKKGDNIVFKIMSDTGVAQEYEMIARKLLEEMIN